MAGLVPAIHVEKSDGSKMTVTLVELPSIEWQPDVDGRDKPGHDVQGLRIQ